MRRLVLPVVLLAACSNDSSGGKKDNKATEPERKLAGVFPDRFQCDTIIKEDELKDLIGALKVQKVESGMAAPRGVPKPCEYQAVFQSEMQGWSYDFDCRDNFKQTADALFEQYRRTSKELQQQFDAAADAGIKPTDAGVVIKRPEDAVDVAVGQKGLDHHGQAILFIDDDAPCYVRVVGPDAAKRLDLAKLIAKNLTFMNAPMMPRAAPQ